MPTVEDVSVVDIGPPPQGLHHHHHHHHHHHPHHPLAGGGGVHSVGIGGGLGPPGGAGGMGVGGGSSAGSGAGGGVDRCSGCGVTGVSLLACDDPDARARGSFKPRFCAECMIGRKVRVFWPVDNSWYIGTVLEHDANTGEHLLKYDDNDTEWVKIGESNTTNVNSTPAPAGPTPATPSTQGGPSPPSTFRHQQHPHHIQQHHHRISSPNMDVDIPPHSPAANTHNERHGNNNNTMDKHASSPYAQHDQQHHHHRQGGPRKQQPGGGGTGQQTSDRTTAPPPAATPDRSWQSGEQAHPDGATADHPSVPASSSASVGGTSAAASTGGGGPAGVGGSGPPGFPPYTGMPQGMYQPYVPHHHGGGGGGGVYPPHAPQQYHPGVHPHHHHHSHGPPQQPYHPQVHPMGPYGYPPGPGGIPSMNDSSRGSPEHGKSPPTLGSNNNVPSSSASVGSSTNNKRKAGPKAWTKEEDALLLSIVQSMRMPMKWSIVAQSLPDRTGKQCRERYVNHLNPRLKITDWSPVEDATIFHLYDTIGSHWAKMSKIIPGRTDNGIKNRFHNLRRQLEREDEHRLRLSTAENFPQEIRLDRLNREFPKKLRGKAAELWDMRFGIGVLAAQSILGGSGSGGTGGPNLISGNSNTNSNPTISTTISSNCSITSTGSGTTTGTNATTTTTNTTPHHRNSGRFGPFRPAEHGDVCVRCGLILPSLHCGTEICTKTGWCQSCTKIPPHVCSNLLRECLNLRRAQDMKQREQIESWKEYFVDSTTTTAAESKAAVVKEEDGDDDNSRQQQQPAVVVAEEELKQ